jgi:predicted transcriptional regulator
MTVDVELDPEYNEFKKDIDGKRCRHTIIYNMLLAVSKKNNNITSIIYSANVDTRTYYKYERLLVSKGLINVKIKGDKRTLVITEKGIKYLQLFKELEHL